MDFIVNENIFPGLTREVAIPNPIKPFLKN
jgi:hypothetical protein